MSPLFTKEKPEEYSPFFPSHFLKHLKEVSGIMIVPCKCHQEWKKNWWKNFNIKILEYWVQVASSPDKHILLIVITKPLTSPFTAYYYIIKMKN